MHNDGNMFAALPLATLTEELVTELLTTPNLRIERIVSTGQATPVDHWYDQDWDEFSSSWETGFGPLLRDARYSAK
jgi:hypothetical protein